MAIIDNFEQIGNMLTFNGDTFYFCQIIMRKKDYGEEKQSQMKNSTVLKSIYIDSQDCWERKKATIKDLCDKTGARAYINPAPKSYESLTKMMLKMISERIFNEDFQSPQTIAEKAAGTLKSDTPIWVVDIDNNDIEMVSKYSDIISKCSPNPGLTKNISTMMTKNGYHLLTTPFNTREFESGCHTNGIIVPDIQKNNPTLLYLNN